MKNLVKYLLPAAIATVTFASCTREQNYNAAPAGEMTIRVHASVNDLKAGDQETKTYIGNDGTHANAILWGTGEYMKLALTAGEATTFATSTDASADTFNGDTEAMFEFSVTPEPASEYVYQGIYPASATTASNNTNAANYKVNLPAIQNATASSYDPAAYIMVAKPETFTSVETDWEASFRRGTALNKITLKNFASSVSINKVKITADGKKLAGGRHFNLTTGESLEVYGTDATIEVLYATPLSGTSMDVWFTSWDTEIAEGEKLTIVAYTTDNKSYTKEITVPAGKTIKFQEGYLNTLGAKMGDITPENVSTFADGDYVILAKKDDSNFYALKGETSDTRIASVDYSGSMTNYSGDASLIWTIAASGTGYTIKNSGNFVGWTSGNSANLIAEADYDATKCLMGIADNGDGTYKIYVIADASRMLARNTGNAYFAFYAGTQYKDIVFVPATSMAQVATPSFDPAAGAVASGSTVSISCATSGATIHYTVDGTDPTASSATYSSPITITSTTTIKAIAVKDGMADSEIASATYSISGSTPTTGWIETALGDLTSSDVFVIVGNDTYAIANDQKTSAGPAPVSVTVTDNALTGTVPDNVKWTLTGNTNDGYTFYSNANSSNFLYCGTTASSGSNDNIRVGSSGSRNVFVLENNHLKTNDSNTARYIGINGTTDFRGYTTSSTNGVTFKFYKYVDAPDNRQEAGMSWSAATASATMTNQGNSFTAPTLTPGNATGITYNSTDTDVATISAAGVVTLVGGGTTTIQAIFAGDTDYKPQTVEYTLNVTDSRTPTIAAVLAGGAKTYNTLDNLLVYAVSGKNAIVGDATGKMLLYIDGHGLSVGDNISISSAVVTLYSSTTLEITGGTINTQSTGNVVDHGTAIDLNDATAASSTHTTFSASGNHSAVYVSMTGAQSGQNIVGTQQNTTLHLNVANPATDGKTVNVTGYIYSWSSSFSNYNFQAISIVEDTTTPTVSVNPSSLNWAATEYGQSNAKTITVTLNGAASADDFVIDGNTTGWTVSNSGSTITVYPDDANTSTTTPKTLVLTISHADDSSVYKEVTCTQAYNGTDWSTTYTSNVTLPVSGTNVSSCKVVISSAEYDGTKLGKNGSGASATIKVPANTTKLYIHCAAWNGKTTTLSVTTTASGVTINPNTAWTLTSDSGIANNSPFTLNAPAKASTDYFKEYTLTGVTSETTITINSTSERAVFWGVNAE